MGLGSRIEGGVVLDRAVPHARSELSKWRKNCEILVTNVQSCGFFSQKEIQKSTTRVAWCLETLMHLDEKPMNPDTAAMITALNHPLRRQILRVLATGRAASATELSELLGIRLGNIAYHMKVLSELKVLWLASTRQVRGAQERFYRSVLNGQPTWAHTALEETRTKDEAV
jgi:DNA-binding transcriptional ArsR family regulator